MALKKKNESKTKYKNSNLTEEQKQEYVKHIFTFMDEERPFINAELNPLCSISFRPAMVQPFGVVTLSISCSGRRLC